MQCIYLSDVILQPCKIYDINCANSCVNTHGKLESNFMFSTVLNFYTGLSIEINYKKQIFYEHWF